MPAPILVRNPNYKEIEQLIAEKVQFTHGYSMRAEWTDKSYKVYSYNTQIGEWRSDYQEWVFLNLSKYSVTTSKQQNLLLRVIKQEGEKIAEY
jgi:hypothetical protein